MQERYFVEGPDGTRYGPADLDTLKAWMAEGRILAEATLLSETSGERVRADSVEGLFPVGVEPPPTTASGAPPAISPAIPPAIPSVMPPVAPAAWQQTPPRKSRTTLYVVLALMGGFGSCILLILAAILFPVFAQAKLAAKRTQGISAMKQLGLGIMIYQNDADDHFPLKMESAKTLQPVLTAYVQNDATLFQTLNPNGGEILGDKRLSGRNTINLVNPSQTIMLHDGLAWPDGRVPVAHADGSAKLLPLTALSSLMTPDPFGGLTAKEERQREKAANP